MGMDVYGIDPVSLDESVMTPDSPDWDTATEEQREAYWQAKSVYDKANPGEYFRANCWSWRPIHELMAQHADDLFSERTMGLMGSNDGAGLRSQEECDLVAERLEEAMKDMNWKTSKHGEYYEPWADMCLVTEEGRFMNDDGTVSVFNNETKETTREVYTGNPMSAYTVYREHLEEFVAFLRACGGFEVW